jgi:hypothetical protein
MAVSDRRYPCEGSMAQLDQPAKEMAQPALIAPWSPNGQDYMHHSAGVTAATSSVQDVSMHTASHLQAWPLTTHTVQAVLVRDYLD